MNINDLMDAIRAEKTRSKWSHGVKTYALEILEDFANNNTEYSDSPADKKELLNGAQDWTQYSEGGCALCYDYDIALRLCTPSELKRTDDGRLNPNSRENWIDCQSRALYQAGRMISRVYRHTERHNSISFKAS